MFSSQRRTKTVLARRLIEDYVFHKQTYAELKETHGIDRRRARQLFAQPLLKQKIHNPRPIHLIVDATYFGERKEGQSWCAIVARDPEKKENLVWSFEETETTYAYVLLKERLEQLGYSFLSVTADGFSGIRSAFHGIPFQMCQVHMERLVIQGTTLHPLTEAGQVLLALTKTIHHTNSFLFIERIKKFHEKYQSFLNEKTIHPFTGEWSYTHEGVRAAWRSLLYFKQYLFTYEHDKQIPKTTNSLEGHFRHVKKQVGVHNGLSRTKQQKILEIIFQASSTSPHKNTLREILK